MKLTLHCCDQSVKELPSYLAGGLPYAGVSSVPTDAIVDIRRAISISPDHELQCVTKSTSSRNSQGAKAEQGVDD